MGRYRFLRLTRLLPVLFGACDSEPTWRRWRGHGGAAVAEPSLTRRRS